MKPKKRSIITTSLAVSLAAAMLIGGAYGYMNNLSAPAKNNADDPDPTLSEELKETSGETYSIIPGISQTSNPTVTVTTTVDAYLFAYVGDETDGLVNWEIADGWNKLESYENVYYREIKGDANEQAFALLKNNSVSYDAGLTNDDMVDDDGKLKDGIQLNFISNAIQQEGFKTVEAAYKAAGVFVSTVDELVTAAGYEGVEKIYFVGDNLKFRGQLVNLNGKTLIMDEDAVISGYGGDYFDGSYSYSNNVAICNGTLSNLNADGSSGLLQFSGVTVNSQVRVKNGGVFLNNVTVNVSGTDSVNAIEVEENGSVYIYGGEYRAGKNAYTINCKDSAGDVTVRYSKLYGGVGAGAVNVGDAAAMIDESVIHGDVKADVSLRTWSDGTPFYGISWDNWIRYTTIYGHAIIDLCGAEVDIKNVGNVNRWFDECTFNNDGVCGDNGDGTYTIK